MTRIALVGDVHASINNATVALYEANRQGADRVIFLGDFGYNFVDSFVEVLHEASEYSGLIVEWIDGNHENFDYLESVNYDLGPNFQYHPRGSVEVIDGVKFLFVGGATSLDYPRRIPGHSWWKQEFVTEEDILRAQSHGKCDVMLSHDSPILPPGLSDDTPFFGKNELKIAKFHRGQIRRIVDWTRPKVLFHGHYHMAYEGSYGETKVVGLDSDGRRDYIRIIETDDWRG